MPQHSDPQTDWRVNEKYISERFLLHLLPPDIDSKRNSCYLLVRLRPNRNRAIETTPRLKNRPSRGWCPRRIFRSRLNGNGYCSEVVNRRGTCSYV
jgi:hypothetical protein